MAFEKGHKKKGGKKKGSVNKATKDIKEAYRMLIEKNLENLTKWLEQIAAKDPAKAIYILSDLSEYVIPKLARTELTGEDGDNIKIQHIADDELVSRIIKIIESTAKK